MEHFRNGQYESKSHTGENIPWIQWIRNLIKSFFTLIDPKLVIDPTITTQFCLLLLKLTELSRWTLKYYQFREEKKIVEIFALIACSLKLFSPFENHFFTVDNFLMVFGSLLKFHYTIGLTSSSPRRWKKNTQHRWQNYFFAIFIIILRVYTIKIW